MKWNAAANAKIKKKEIGLLSISFAESRLYTTCFGCHIQYLDEHLWLVVWIWTIGAQPLEPKVLV